MRKLLIIFALALCVAGNRVANKTSGGGGGGSTPYVTAQTLGTLRNDFSGEVGFKFVVGSTPITITDLGRWVVAGNSGTHVITLYNASGVSQASVTVNTSGATSGQYLYGSITPYLTTASTAYYIETTEANAGDQWYDNDTTLSVTGAAAQDVSVANGSSQHGPPNAYVPPNFKYH